MTVSQSGLKFINDTRDNLRYLKLCFSVVLNRVWVERNAQLFKHKHKDAKMDIASIEFDIN